MKCARLIAFALEGWVHLGPGPGCDRPLVSWPPAAGLAGNDEAGTAA